MFVHETIRVMNMCHYDVGFERLTSLNIFIFDYQQFSFQGIALNQSKIEVKIVYNGS